MRILDIGDVASQCRLPHDWECLIWATRLRGRVRMAGWQDGRQWQAHTGPGSESCLGGDSTGHILACRGYPGAACVFWCRRQTARVGWWVDNPSNKLESCTEGSKGVNGRVLMSRMDGHPCDLPAVCTAISTQHAGRERLHGHGTGYLSYSIALMRMY